MATLAKTIVATGASSGIGLEVVKQLLEQSSPYRFILGARDTQRAQNAVNEIKYDSATHNVTILPLELSDMRSVKTFAQKTLEKLGQGKIDYLLLNAALNDPAKGPGPFGSKWSLQYVVNHLSQHYLTHLFRSKIVESHSRVVFVSSGAIRMVNDDFIASLENDIKANSGAETMRLYPQTKFLQLLAAHWWRRELGDKATVVAVSPGLIAGTGLGRGNPAVGNTFSSHPDAKDVPTGARSVLAAFTRNDFPEDRERIFLTSWGEWWEKDVYALALDKKLQDKWSPSLEAIEKEEGC